MPDEPLTDKITTLWRERFGGADTVSLTPCALGGNNRVYRVEANGKMVAAKLYFADSRDGRDRLDAEWRFLSYAADRAIPETPRPLARDPAARIAFHEFCPGTRPSFVDGAAVDAAAALFRALNEARDEADLPDAAEACFSIDAHLARIDLRLERLRLVDDDAARRLLGEMEEFWRDYRRLLAGWNDNHLDLPQAQRCVSPSDFGFHNALVTADGSLRFIDFEYAGWDDPVKMLCDFFLQPALPVDLVHYDRFFSSTLGNWPQAVQLASRARAMFPLFSLKWCCIMLNPFLPDLEARARFADPTQEDLKTRRLAAATTAFRRLKDY